VQRLDRAQKSKRVRHRAILSLKYISMLREPPIQAAPLIRGTRAASLFHSQSSLFRRQSRHECTLSHRSPRSRRSRELNQPAGIRAAIRVALHRHADCCLAGDSGVDRQPRMAGGQGIQPLVTQPVTATVVADRRSDVDTFDNPLRSVRAQCPRTERLQPCPSCADAQSDLGVRCVIAWIASPRSVSLASCS